MMRIKLFEKSRIKLLQTWGLIVITGLSALAFAVGCKSTKPDDDDGGAQPLYGPRSSVLNINK